MALIELRKISKAYGSVPALRELDLTVPEGCLYGLLGPNGAGKTTAMRILATLLAPDSGSVLLGVLTVWCSHEKCASSWVMWPRRWPSTRS